MTPKYKSKQIVQSKSGKTYRIQGVCKFANGEPELISGEFHYSVCSYRAGYGDYGAARHIRESSIVSGLVTA